MNRILIVIAVLGLAVAAYFGYTHFEHGRLVAAIVSHVKNASLRAANSARYETASDTKITYKELFDKLEADIAEVDKHLIDVQTLASPKTAAVTDPAVTYLQSIQEYLRAMLQKYRKALALSNAIDWAKKMDDESRESSGYGAEYAERNAGRALRDAGEGMKEYDASVSDLRAAALKLKAARASLAKLLPTDALMVESQIDAVIAKNAPKGEPSASSPK